MLFSKSRDLDRFGGSAAESTGPVKIELRLGTKSPQLLARRSGAAIRRKVSYSLAGYAFDGFVSRTEYTTFL